MLQKNIFEFAIEFWIADQLKILRNSHLLIFRNSLFLFRYKCLRNNFSNDNSKCLFVFKVDWLLFSFKVQSVDEILSNIFARIISHLVLREGFCSSPTQNYFHFL